MIRLMFLLPIILCLAWYFFLKANNVTMKEGRKGFFYILAFSAILLGFFSMMIYITQ
ncbi:hypothetical protein PULV_a0466 [Pseudoalteromonas ulvae UL12]|uniref:hypothetical protein n=1 Tax=Pseudoalteromonas ulvae TaxID=107327 RepID=UPI0015943EFC|nr:hypothetical protein [Pseudoalteromonas ulvae]MBE0362877.1 hypothetical protein [Pseudoalteromonas ulvae UL12]